MHTCVFLCGGASVSGWGRADRMGVCRAHCQWPLVLSRFYYFISTYTPRLAIYAHNQPQKAGQPLLFVLFCLGSTLISFLTIINKSNVNFWINPLNGNAQCFMHNIKIKSNARRPGARLPPLPSPAVNSFYMRWLRGHCDASDRKLTHIRGREWRNWRFSIIGLFKWLSMAMSSSARWTRMKHLLHHWVDLWCRCSCSREYLP